VETYTTLDHDPRFIINPNWPQLKHKKIALLLCGCVTSLLTISHSFVTSHSLPSFHSKFSCNNSTGEPLSVSRQISRHDPKLDHRTNYVPMPNYETTCFHLPWGGKNQMMKARVTVGTMRSLVRSSQSTYYLLSQMTKNSFLC
jgi:hypothetical protein